MLLWVSAFPSTSLLVIPKYYVSARYSTLQGAVVAQVRPRFEMTRSWPFTFNHPPPGKQPNHVLLKVGDEWDIQGINALLDWSTQGLCYGCWCFQQEPPTVRDRRRFSGVHGTQLSRGTVFVSTYDNLPLSGTPTQTCQILFSTIRPWLVSYFFRGWRTASSREPANDYV